MEEISTTNPPPPSGVTPTEVPLGISSTVSETTNPVNNDKLRTEVLNINMDAYLSKFTILSTQGPTTNVFSWNSHYPLELEGQYRITADATQTGRALVPWALLTPFFSKQCRIDWALKFTPVKISDARCSLDFVVNYEGEALTYANVNPNQVMLANDSFHKIVDDLDDPFEIVVPMFWLTNNVQTDSNFYQPNSGLGTRLQPTYLPKTSVNVFIRSPYQPNQMQTPSFDMVVTIVPIVRQTLGMAAKSLIRNYTPTTTDYFPTPYFLNYE